MHWAVNTVGIPHLAKNERDVGPGLGEGTRLISHLYVRPKGRTLHKIKFSAASEVVP